jgi:carbon-monoxide dehydrogenase large subunit
VSYVGEPVAMVVADNRYVAEDAAMLVVIDYDPLPALADVRRAAGGSPVRRELSSNVITTYKVEFGDTERSFSKAAHVFGQTLWQHRGGAHSIETRGLVAEIRQADGGVTVHASTQKAHDLQQTLTSLLDCDQPLHVIAPDIGGGFGAKLCVYSEDVAVVAAARLLGRSIKWIEDRQEYFVAAVHERDQFWELEIAVDVQAKILGIRGKLLHDTGAYTPQDPNIPYNSASTMSGPYVVPNLSIEVTIAMTNKTPVSSVRGAGYPQAAFAMERLLDLVAHEMGSTAARCADAT